MNPEARIPFSIECTEPGREYVVTLTLHNVLAQPVATPQAFKGGRLLNKLKLSCGSYTAYWDGKYTRTGQKAASGVYYYILEVDGHKFPPMKLMVAK